MRPEVQANMLGELNPYDLDVRELDLIVYNYQESDEADDWRKCYKFIRHCPNCGQPTTDCWACQNPSDRRFRYNVIQYECGSRARYRYPVSSTGVHLYANSMCQDLAKRRVEEDVI